MLLFSFRKNIWEMELAKIISKENKVIGYPYGLEFFYSWRTARYS